MRVSDSYVFSDLVNKMQMAESRMMTLNEHASSQKKVNKPSDNPLDSARILGYRGSIESLDQYKRNIDNAKGWLNLADETLTQTQDVIIRARELAEQAATGSMDASNRKQVSYELRQIFKQLVSMSNTSYEGNSIFAGHKVDSGAFREVLAVTTNDQNLKSNFFSKVEGSTANTVLIQFTSSGQVPSPLTYRYSSDGGKTFENGVTNGNQITIGGVRLSLASGTTVRANSATDTNDASGTWLWIRPSAEYIGDDGDNLPDSSGQRPTIVVDKLVTGNAAALSTTAQGSFSRNAIIRVDNQTPPPVNYNGTVQFSYSLDGGITWVSSNSSTNGMFVIPGGILQLSSAGSFGLHKNDQFVIRPNTADISVEISPNETVRINNVGKEIFGGVYKKYLSNAATPIDFGGGPERNYLGAVVLGSNAGSNLFETVGKLIGYLETNNQSGIQECLANLKESQSQVSNKLADIGGRENRVSISESVRQSLKLNTQDRLSKVEDIDVSELMTRLVNQQIIYETLLRSSSMIMQMNLSNYL